MTHHGSFVIRRNPAQTWPQTRAFLSLTGSHFTEIGARYDGKIVISSFVLVLVLILLISVEQICTSMITVKLRVSDMFISFGRFSFKSGNLNLLWLSVNSPFSKAVSYPFGTCQLSKSLLVIKLCELRLRDMSM